MNEEIIFGKNAIIEALLSKSRNINKIMISKNLHSDTKLNQIKELAMNQNIIFQFVSKEKFAPYGEYNHQGVMALVSPIKFVDLDDYLKEEHTNSSIVILDGIEDPHNLGAIIRSCVCAGVDAIIIPSRRNAQVNSVVEKASEGAVNRIPIIKVNSLINAIQKLQKSDWWIIATDASAKDNYYDIDYNNMNYAIVMGAEHSGVSKSITKSADMLVKIPMMRDFNSLNVSNALSIIIFEAVRQKAVKMRKDTGK